MCTMYCVRLTDVLLLFATFFFFMNLFIDCQRCKPEMTYHRHSQTCLVVVNLNKTHENAERYCADTYSGGHLVYILDSETNNFTNSLLRENESYHIGLSDTINNGDYRWTNGQTANYTNFKTDRTPNLYHYYILMYNSVWYEYYNLEAKFICQKSAERKEFFLLNDTNFINKINETDVLTTITLKCGTHDDKEHHFQIFYRNFDGTELHLSHLFGIEHSHVTYTRSNSSGVYVCRITDSVNRTVATLAGTLKVRCRATYCNKEDANLNLRVHDHTGYTDGTICVFVYPRPNLENIVMCKENASQNTFKLKYNINFTYTEEISSRGEFHIRLYNVTPSDYGSYYIHARNDISSKLYFKLAGAVRHPSGGLASKTNIVVYIIPIVLVILVICVVITVLVRKRKNHNKINDKLIDQKELEYFCGTETISPQNSNLRNTYIGNGAEVSLCSTEAAENSYNNVLEHKAQQGAKVLKPARKSGSSVEFEDVSIPTGDHQAKTLPLGKTLVTWDNEKGDANVYDNTLDDTSEQDQELKGHRKETAMPSNVEEIPNLELDKQNVNSYEDFRTVSAEGLVYVSVEISRSGPQIVSENPKVTEKLDKNLTKGKKKTQIIKEVKPSYEDVEYSSLDYLATSVAASEEGVIDLTETNAQE